MLTQLNDCNIMLDYDNINQALLIQIKDQESHLYQQLITSDHFNYDVLYHPVIKNLEELYQSLLCGLARDDDNFELIIEIDPSGQYLTVDLSVDVLYLHDQFVLKVIKYS